MSEQEDVNEKVKELLGRFKKSDLTDLINVEQSEVEVSESDKEMMFGYINQMKEDGIKELTFAQISDETGFEFSSISAILLALITDGRALGFINDKGTEDPSDDVLILRDKVMEVNLDD